MGVEIERKFLVNRELWPGSARSTLLRQGYLSRERGRTVRARRAGDRAFITIKGEAEGLVRPEFEYEVPVADIDALLSLCIQPILEKRRHLCDHEGHTWEVDEFLGANAGLWVAEIELGRVDEAFVRPPWLGDEVTDDPRYLNSNLVVHPYAAWRDSRGDGVIPSGRASS
jgi:adenylate cyclase